MTTVLIIDDELDMRHLIEVMLLKSNFRTLTAENGQQAYELLKNEEIDLILLDVMMPAEDGFQVCTKIRFTSDVPIIFLTARDANEDKVKGLTIGGDDYITKPFSMEELMERVKAITRRTILRFDSSHVFQLSTYTFDSIRHVLIRNGVEKKLTSRELNLLYLFCEYKNRVVERSLALQRVWHKENYFNARNMDVYITKLRKLLKDDPNVELQNIHGIGYRLVVRE